MTAIPILVPRSRTCQASLEGYTKILEYHRQNLYWMECQFLAGENMELPVTTLDQWREALSLQRTKVETLQQELLDTSREALSPCICADKESI